MLKRCSPSVCCLAVLLLALSPAGCSSDSARTCDEDGDCFEGEACVSGSCERADESDGGSGGGAGSRTTGGGATAGSSGSGGTTGGSSGGSGGTTGGSSGDMDVGGGSGGTTGGSSGEMDVGGGGVCEGHFGTCQDEEFDNNGQRSNGKRFFPELDLYCEPGESRKLDAEETLSGHLCPKEENGTDWYRVKVAPCEDTTVTVRAELDTRPVCPDEQLEFDVQCAGGGGRVGSVCEGEAVRRGRNGDTRWIELYPDDVSSFWFIYFKVSAPGADGSSSTGPDFGYDLNISVTS